MKRRVVLDVFKVKTIYEAGCTQEYLSRKFKITVPTLRKFMKKNNIQTRAAGARIKHTDSVDIKKIRLMFDEGKAIREIAEAFMLPWHVMYRILKKENILRKRARPRPKGISPLINIEPKYVEDLYDGGMLMKDIAKKLQVSPYILRNFCSLHAIWPFRHNSFRSKLKNYWNESKKNDQGKTYRFYKNL